MKKLLLILLCVPFFLVGQECLVGDCENGLGIYEYEDEYEGRFKNGMRHGYGVYTEYDYLLGWKGGTKESGEWEKNQLNGICTINFFAENNVEYLIVAYFLKGKEIKRICEVKL